MRNIFLVFSFLFFLPYLHAQTVLRVDKTNVSGTYNGDTWGTAYQSISDALADPDPFDEIWVAAGEYFIYKPGAGANKRKQSAVRLVSDVAIYGHFDKTESSPANRDLANSANATILNGLEEGGSNQVYHVVIADGVTNCRLDGFTIKNGLATNAGASKLTPSDCASADNGAGGTSKEAVLACVGAGSGGGILINQADPVIANCIIKDNQGEKGAGVYVMVAASIDVPASEADYPDAPEFINCTFSNNTAGVRGGAIALDLYTSPTFTNCKIMNNHCGDKGGGVYMDWTCHPTFTNCLVVENDAIRGGAMGIDGSSNPTFINCTVANNTAKDIGAGLYTGSYKTHGGSSNTPRLMNSIVSQNTNTYGGPADLAVWHENHFYVENSIIGNGFTAVDGIDVIVDAGYLFADMAAGDYRIQGADAIGAGVDLDTEGNAAPSHDIVGTTRDLFNPDLGAYEEGALNARLAQTLLLEVKNEEEKARLNWTTKNEGANTGYEILKSTNGKAFESLTTLKSGHYTWLDEAVKQGETYFYKVIQLTSKGKGLATEIQSISFNHLNITAYPNPTSGMLYLSVDNSFEDLQLEVYNSLGQLITTSIEQEGNMATLNTESLESGIYWLSIFDKVGQGNTNRLKIIVTK